MVYSTVSEESQRHSLSVASVETHMLSCVFLVSDFLVLVSDSRFLVSDSRDFGF